MILNKIASFSYMLLLLLTSCINNNQTLFPNENYFDSINLLSIDTIEYFESGFPKMIINSYKNNYFEENKYFENGNIK